MLADSNTLLYSIDPARQYVHDFVVSNVTAVSIITLIEVYGYPRITQIQSSAFDLLLAQIEIVPLTKAIVRQAIQLRQRRRISLGDSIIAATAFLRGLPLATRNVRNFSWIEGLQLADPV